MAGLAQILKESGQDVSGADAQFYPPMSDYLKKIGIKTIEGYKKKSLPEADLYVIGNALSRGNECVEEILDQKLPYVSGPEMLGKELKNRNVFAISGTHGKTTTSYMLAHIFLDQGREIGYLVGGISDDFDNSVEILDQARKKYPDHPGVHLIWAASRWVRSQANEPVEKTYRVLEADLREIKPMLKEQLSGLNMILIEPLL